MSKNYNKVNFGEVQVENRLSFKPNPDLYNGLCLATITKVELEEVEIPTTTDTGTPSQWDMAGHKSYNLIVEFKQSGVDKERFITLRESIVGATTKTGDAIEPKTWNNLVVEQYRRLQHIVKVLDNSKIGKMSKALPESLYPDYADSVEARIAKAKKMFTHFVEMIKGKEEVARYEGVTFWLKIITKVPEQTYYTIPNFVGKGYLEVFNNGIAPALELSPNESIILKKKDEKKAETKPDMNHKDEDAVKPAASAETPEELLKRLGVSTPK